MNSKQKKIVRFYYKFSGQIKRNKNIGFGNSLKKETIYTRKCNLFFSTCLRLEIHEIFLRETYGTSEETSLCLILSTNHFQVWYFKVHKFVNKCVNWAIISTFLYVQRYLVMTAKISGSVIVLFTGKLSSSFLQNMAV